MPTYTVQVVSQCTGGEHIRVNVLRDGVAVKTTIVLRSEVIGDNPPDWQDALTFFIRSAIKKAGATTLAQAKAAVEAASWEF